MATSPVKRGGTEVGRSGEKEGKKMEKHVSSYVEDILVHIALAANIIRMFPSAVVYNVTEIYVPPPSAPHMTSSYIYVIRNACIRRYDLIYLTS